MYQLEISERAEVEYNQAYWFYEDERPGLGELLELEADSTLASIRSNPYIFQRKFKRFREALLRRFPYFIVYEIVSDKVVVHSFFHTSRNPKMKYKASSDPSTVNEPSPVYKIKKTKGKVRK